MASDARVQLLHNGAAKIPVRFSGQPNPVVQERTTTATGQRVKEKERPLARAQRGVPLLGP